MRNTLAFTATCSSMWSALLVGCVQIGTDSPGHYSKETFRDENGVEVHMHNGSFPGHIDGWSVSSVPSGVVPDTARGHRLFQLLAGPTAVRLTNGGLAVVHGRGGRVAFLNDRGDVVREIESGRGPAGFGLAGAIFRDPSGGAVIWDVAENRARFMSSDGELLKAVSIAGPVGGWGQNGGPRGVLTGGRLVTVTHEPYRHGSGRPEARDRYTVTLFDADGSVLTTVDDLEGPLLQRASSGMYVQRPLEYDPFVLVSDNEIFVFDGDLGEVRIYNVDGRLVRVVQRQNPERGITRQRRATYLRGLEAVYRELGVPEDMIAEARKQEWPAQEGYFLRGIVAPSGRILMAEQEHAYSGKLGVDIAGMYTDQAETMKDHSIWSSNVFHCSWMSAS